MLNVTVRVGSDVGDYVGLETLDDVEEYFEQQNVDVQNLTRKVITSGVPPERWDHLYEKSPAGSTFVAAVARCKIEGGNPLLELGAMSDQKAMRIAMKVAGGEVVLINSVGGYCTLDSIESSTVHQIIKKESGTLQVKETVFLTEGAKYINLENDDELEKTTLEYMKEVDPNFAYVLNLHKHDTARLIEIFNEFKSNGGTTVYVYTTGINVPQMYDYCDAIISSRLPNVEFEFNSGMTDRHHDVVEYLKDQGIVVTIRR